MRSYLVPTLCLWLMTTQLAGAFDLDGFFSGMTKAEVLQKLRAEGIEPKSDFPGLGQIEGGVYNIAFCNDRIVAVTKSINFREFNSLLIEMLREHGNPTVDIPSVDSDILYLRWNANGEEYGLNSGTTEDGKRFHNIGEIDNTFCKK